MKFQLVDIKRRELFHSIFVLTSVIRNVENTYVFTRCIFSIKVVNIKFFLINNNNNNTN